MRPSPYLSLPAALLAVAFALPVGAAETGPPPPFLVPETSPRPESSALPEAPLPVPQPERPPQDPEGPPAEFRHPNDWRYIVVHHSASPSGNAASFDAMHKRKGWDGLAYHFVITNGKGGPDGQLQVGARWWRQKHGAHAGGLASSDPEARNEFNEFGIGICLVGNFEHKPPTRAQMKTLAWLIRKLQNEHGISGADVVGHRHVKSTACPGRHFPWKTLFAMLELPAPTHLARRHPVTTYGRCPWCAEADTLAFRPPARPLLPGQPTPDVPPPLMLNGR